MTHRHLAAIAALTFALPLTSCHWGPRVWVEETRKIELNAAGTETLRAITDNGSIRVSGNPAASTISVEATVRGGGESTEDARDCLKAIELETPTDGTTQILESGFRERKSGWRRRVSFAVVVPDRLRLDLRSDNGAINVDGVHGDTKVRTDNGAVEVVNTSGAIDAKTDNGKIRVLTLASSETPAPTVKLKTDNGSIVATLGSTSQLDVNLQTDNGSVTLDLDERASAEIFASTDNGRIKADLPLQYIAHDKTSLRAKLGDRAGKVEVETDNGSITLK